MTLSGMLAQNSTTQTAKIKFAAVMVVEHSLMKVGMSYSIGGSGLLVAK
jgi:hypothetical protein